jgi:hypothetical protein
VVRVKVDADALVDVVVVVFVRWAVPVESRTVAVEVD